MATPRRRPFWIPEEKEFGWKDIGTGIYRKQSDSMNNREEKYSGAFSFQVCPDFCIFPYVHTYTCKYTHTHTHIYIYRPTNIRAYIHMKCVNIRRKLAVFWDVTPFNLLEFCRHFKVLAASIIEAYSSSQWRRQQAPLKRQQASTRQQPPY
jgi:hypothetical protein